MAWSNCCASRYVLLVLESTSLLHHARVYWEYERGLCEHFFYHHSRWRFILQCLLCRGSWRRSMLRQRVHHDHWKLYHLGPGGLLWGHIHDNLLSKSLRFRVPEDSNSGLHFLGKIKKRCCSYPCLRTNSPRSSRDLMNHTCDFDFFFHGKGYHLSSGITPLIGCTPRTKYTL